MACDAVHQTIERVRFAGAAYERPRAIEYAMNVAAPPGYRLGIAANGHKCHSPNATSAGS